jgi:tetraacyldisaccharide-1-P 4'-kinase
LMTSKDAVRCAAEPGAGRCWHVPVDAMLGADEGRLRELLAQKLGLREA